ncbi:hypothetical protein EUGRSUZ_E00185 [Eucalyptus grandis]|uniref:Uncharacterized protein n=2 Tax=Eucalyptus grandis TaxID=71139 RepID=A0ACC3KRQ7_EUCGR|nr:hypothetical protein EUGRSUZ_E00185 [Eucalyptus grandis]
MTPEQQRRSLLCSLEPSPTAATLAALLARAEPEQQRSSLLCSLAQISSEQTSCCRRSGEQRSPRSARVARASGSQIWASAASSEP